MTQLRSGTLRTAVASMNTVRIFIMPDIFTSCSSPAVIHSARFGGTTHECGASGGCLCGGVSAADASGCAPGWRCRITGLSRDVRARGSSPPSGVRCPASGVPCLRSPCLRAFARDPCAAAPDACAAASDPCASARDPCACAPDPCACARGIDVRAAFPVEGPAFFVPGLAMLVIGNTIHAVGMSILSTEVATSTRGKQIPAP